jgi:hypothetical protein
VVACCWTRWPRACADQAQRRGRLRPLAKRARPRGSGVVDQPDQQIDWPIGLQFDRSIDPSIHGRPWDDGRRHGSAHTPDVENKRPSSPRPPLAPWAPQAPAGRPCSSRLCGARGVARASVATMQEAQANILKSPRGCLSRDTTVQSMLLAAASQSHGKRSEAKGSPQDLTPSNVRALTAARRTF